MKNYIDFTIEELVLDAYFRKWVTNKLPSEDNFWQELLAKNPTQIRKFEVASEIIKTLEIENSPNLSDEEVTQEVKRIFQVAVEKKPVKLVPILSQYWLRIAAVVVLTVGIGWYINTKLSEPLTNIPSTKPKLIEDEFIHLVNDGETAAKYTLLDSTNITLKSKSTLSYPKHFAVDKREVYLKGEANFDVKREANRPFIIHTEKIITKVLGTKFKVKAYEQDKNIAVSVSEGKVAVAKENTEVLNNENGVLLTRNQSVIFDKLTGKFTKFTSFKPIKLNDFYLMEYDFNNAPLASVFEELEKEYDVRILYDTQQVKGCFITAKLTNTTFYKLLDFVCDSSNSKYEIYDGKIMISSKGCK